MNRGLVHIYTGNGKGKTTAALGDAVHAAILGRSVYIGQFMKGIAYSEIAILRGIPGIKVEQYGNSSCLLSPGDVTKEDIAGASRGMDSVRRAMFYGSYDIVILDEINVSLWFGIVKLQDLLGLILEKPFGTALILTGRYAPRELLDHADQVTDVREIKHYYMQDVQARYGIER